MLVVASLNWGNVHSTNVYVFLLNESKSVSKVYWIETMGGWKSRVPDDYGIIHYRSLSACMVRFFKMMKL